MKKELKICKGKSTWYSRINREQLALKHNLVNLFNFLLLEQEVRKMDLDKLGMENNEI